MTQEVAPKVWLWSRYELHLPHPVSAIGQAAKTEFIVHHSGGQELGRSDFAAWWQNIYDHHTGTNHWNDIGYNFGVANDRFDPEVAHILEGRSWNGIGAHTKSHNVGGMGVCYLRNGGATPGAKRAYRWLYDEACKRNGERLSMKVHGDLNPTECPGDLAPWVHAGMVAPALSPSAAPAKNALRTPAVGILQHPTRDGYWLVASDGGVFGYGDVGFYGSMGGQKLNAPIVGAAVHPTGEGYWLVGSDGGVFAFGVAGYFGSMAGRGLNAAVTSIAASRTGNGYTLGGADGGVFCFGDAQFHGAPVEVLS